jgi:signal transduction histidine kinase
VSDTGFPSKDDLGVRSLRFKLTLGFLVVGLTGSAIVALFVGVRTRREFDRFVLDRYQESVVEHLVDHYATNGSWDGAAASLLREPDVRREVWRHGRLPITVADPDGTIVVGPRTRLGDSLRDDELEHAVSLEVGGSESGLLVFEPPMGAPRPVASPEADYLRRINRALLLGAIGASAAALLIGVFLARNITGPVRKLTDATQVVADGGFGYQVTIDSRDEIGELATAFNKMSSDLDRSEQARRRMTADIAHDLRTPTTVILGYAEGLVEGHFEVTPELLSGMFEEARHLDRLIEELRTLTLADSGELRLQLTECAPEELVQRAKSVHGPFAEAKGVSLQAEVSDGLPNVLVDPERIAQVFGNLVSNALRHTEAGGTITLSAEMSPSPTTVIFRVSDTGEGILPDDLPHVFDRHWRADRSRQTARDASGLGLAIAKTIVEAHAGTITVRSSPGSGSAFTISLPASASAAATT